MRLCTMLHAPSLDLVVDYETHTIFDLLEDNSIDAVFDNFGGNGTADAAMPKLRVGGTYLLLPHGNGQGALSKHPKVGVRQINFGDVDNTQHSTLDQMRDMFDSHKLRVNVSGVSGVQRAFDFDEAAEAYSTVAAGEVHGKLAIIPN